MKKVAVSVIMPSLNVASYIEKAIISVLNQSLKNIEIICVDAGSTDGTLEIIKKYCTIDDRIKLLISDYKSYGAQVNMGIEVAVGKYIAILETDDYIGQGMYEALYNAGEDYECDFVKCNYYTYWSQKDGSPFIQKRYNLWDESLYGKLITNPYPKDVCINDLYLWDGIYKKDFLQSSNISFSETEGAAFQDVSFLFQTSIKCKRIMYLEEAYYYYCIDREESSSNSNRGFLYSFHEYNFVNAIYKDLITENAIIAKTYYCRLALALYNSVNDPMQIYGRTAKPYYEWFCNEIKWAICKGIINDNDTNFPVPLLSLILPYEEYVRKQNIRKDRIISVIGKPNQYNIGILGSGRFGISAYRWLSGMGYRIFTFVDNDKSKWKKKVDGINICSPESLDVANQSIRYIVANNTYSEEMKRQLMELGVREEFVCTY